MVNRPVEADLGKAATTAVLGLAGRATLAAVAFRADGDIAAIYPCGQAVQRRSRRSSRNEAGVTLLQPRMGRRSGPSVTNRSITDCASSNGLAPFRMHQRAHQYMCTASNLCSTAAAASRMGNCRVSRVASRNGTSP